MRARRGVHVGREKSWAVVEISPARHQSTADQRCCGDGELQRSEADVDNLNYAPAILITLELKTAVPFEASTVCIATPEGFTSTSLTGTFRLDSATNRNLLCACPHRVIGACLSGRSPAGLVRCPSSFRRRLRSRADLFDCDAAAGNRGGGQARGTERQGETPLAVG